MSTSRTMVAIAMAFVWFGALACSGGTSDRGVLDTESGHGSGIVLTDLSSVQASNLAMLGKVWGFLKYHHPAVTGGKRNWDEELFRILPRVLAATDSNAAESEINRWIALQGTVPSCDPCATLTDRDLYTPPSLTWLTGDQLGTDLRATLRGIYRNRSIEGHQFYVSLTPKIGNPSFDHEAAYPNVRWPDAGYQLLALFRFWNIIEYWFPYRDVIGESWDDVLTAYIPRIALARDGDSYKREMLALIANVHDTHANLWSSLEVRPPVGQCEVPIRLRFIQDQAVVTGYVDGSSGIHSRVTPGDVVTAVNDVAVTQLVSELAPFYAASNEPARRRDLARWMTRGVCGPTTLTVSREGTILKQAVSRTAPWQEALNAELTHERRGDAFQRLSPEVAYLRISSAKASEAARYVESAAGTQGFIIDTRGYPSDSMVSALGSRFVEKPTAFARFTTGDVTNPGAFYWQADPAVLQPLAPHYSGKIVILVDEVTISAAEYTAMALRVAPHAIVVGSTTAGADGNVSAIPLPGGLRSMISGIGVFYPDKRATQRVGIAADVEAKPTVLGIRSGRDEVLEAGIRQILGPSASADVIQHLAQR